MAEKDRTSSLSSREIIDTEETDLRRLLGLSSGGSIIGDDSRIGEDTVISPPSFIFVRDQKTRFMPDGSYVTDVIIAWSPVPGAQTYEVRIAKVD